MALQSPALSFAHLVKASALAETGNISAARQALLLSEYSAGNSIPYAQRRAALWVKHFSDLSDVEQVGLSRDITRIAAQDIGMRWIAGQYAARADMRPFIMQAMQAMPDARQSAFLAAVRRISQ